MVFLRQLYYDIKNQLKAPKTPYLGLWNEMTTVRDISCLSLVLYGIMMVASMNIKVLLGGKKECIKGAYDKKENA